ncbi:primosomal protein N' [Aliikangiella coralliicola]|uniref:primosomal protein N' n=1 Tax=Aliikangiella coralliicola TaxID=2592383 RepID=UPI00143CCAC1|nr:primosomal protein N' [Aliikangiella coralliicola]
MAGIEAPQLPLSSENYCIVKVAVPVPLRRVFDYLLPENYPITPQPGMRVQIPFGRTTKIGIIDEVESLDHSDLDTQLEKLKPITQILDDSPLITESLISLYRWMGQYYHAPFGEIWQTLLPTALLKGKPAKLSRSSRWTITDIGRESLESGKLAKSAVKQKLILEQLIKNPTGIAHDKIKDFDIPYSSLKNLAGKKWVSRDYITDNDKNIASQVNLPSDIQLNDEQLSAIETVSQHLDRYTAFLLFGVTASGKTEVYLRLIQQVIEQQRQALVLVPEIGLTPQTLRRFEQRFNVSVVTLHSGMSEQQRLQSWLKAKNGEAKIIIGTRSALFAPLKNPGIIIIDEEHDLSFRQQQGFRYSARDVAMVRANLEKIPVLLGSASPSLESLSNVSKGKIKQIELTQKAQNTASLKYRVIDLKNQPMNQGLSADLIKSIKQHLQQKGQVLLFLNRRGYAPVLLCHQCGWSSSCQRCDTHYTYHHQNDYLQCHHCGSSRKAPHQCPQCQCDQMVPVGLGTERLTESIKHLFPDAKTARIDRDTTRRKSAMQDFVSSVKAGEIDILVGTQMLAKGHHFPDVTLVALIDMDGALYSADFRAPEYAAQLITQVSGRAGRADKPGEVLIQTHHAEHSMLHQIIHSGYGEFANSALNERVEAELPPHTFLAMFQAESPQMAHVKYFLADVKQILDRYSNLKVELLGPAPAVYVKKAGKFRYQLFLQTSSRNQLHQLLELTLGDIEKLKSASRVRWRVEIDPVGDS